MKSCRQQHTSNTSSTTSVTWQRCSVERVWLFSNQELNSWCHKAAQTSFLWPQPKWTSWLCRWCSEVMWKSYGLPHPEAFFFFFFVPSLRTWAVFDSAALRSSDGFRTADSGSIWRSLSSHPVHLSLSLSSSSDSSADCHHVCVVMICDTMWFGVIIWKTDVF